MSAPFIDLEATADPNVWRLPAVPRLCVGSGLRASMFGGVGLGSAIRALENTFDQPVIWASAQFVAHAVPGSIVELTVTLLSTGKYNSQARVTSQANGRDLLMVSAALGRRPGDLARQWRTVPEMVPPERSAPFLRYYMRDGGLNGQFDVRLGRPVSDDSNRETQQGRVFIWIRPLADYHTDAAMLAVMADFAPMGIGRALGGIGGGFSLDNTIRIHRLVQTDWVLCDLWISDLRHGIGHVDTGLFAQDRSLLASASQSVIVRLTDPELARAVTQADLDASANNTADLRGEWNPYAPVTPIR